jgi:hypothetical protein
MSKKIFVAGPFNGTDAEKENRVRIYPSTASNNLNWETVR